MGYPQRLLGTDERIERAVRPHWRVQCGPALVLLVTVPVASFAASAVGSQDWRLPARSGIAAVAALVLLVGAIVPFVQWYGTRYVLTNRRIIVRTGLLTRRGRDVPLSRVVGVSFEKTLIERLLGCGTLLVGAAGEGGELVLQHVPDVERVQAEVYRLAEQDHAWPAHMPGQKPARQTEGRSS